MIELWNSLTWIGKFVIVMLFGIAIVVWGAYMDELRDENGK